jgi:putative tricarboxylic transport membrane protein
MNPGQEMERFEMEEKIGRRPGEQWFLWFLLMFSLFFLHQSFRIPGLKSFSSSGAFPIFICTVLALSTIRVMLKNRKRFRSPSAGPREELKEALAFVFPKTIIIYVGILVLYMVMLQPLHFIGSSFIFLVISMLYLKGATLRRVFFIAAGTIAAIYLIFQTLFKVILW